ncbi:cytochrome P450 2J2-like [Eublepharis macularius]|uniref:Cytochrome P450 2J2-like n=1 Tax=Eublepharis macularius TaxID=481883 RepID=A0AA97L1B0_EUBMA|nr:cytochrome P450 2J2-like [Eublepharis macularius]
MCEGTLWLPELFLLFVISLQIFHFLKLQWTRRQLPPGPSPLPVIGNLWLLGFQLQGQELMKLASTYGNIFTVWMGTNPMVVLSGYKAVTEGIISEELSGRPLTPFFRVMMGDKGVFLTNGHTWKQQRRFAFTALRNLATNIQHRIQEEARHLVEVLASQHGSAFEPKPHMIHAVANVICATVFGYRFPTEDESFNKMIKAIYLIILVPFTATGRLYDAFPRIMHRLPGRHQQVLKYNDFLHKEVKKRIQSHKEKWNEGEEPQNLVDFYLGHMEKTKDDPKSTFSEDNMVQIMIDLLIGGTENTASLLCGALLLMVKHPEVQEKVLEEINAVLEPSQTVCYEDRTKLPYTNAVVHEILRLINVVGIGPFRLCLEDTTLLGSHIAKGTLVLPNIVSVLADPEFWESPSEFNPGHFLDSKGNFVLNKAFIAFGTGRRVCLGEHMAWEELFIFFTTVLRAFVVQLPEGEQEADINSILKSPRQHHYKLRFLPH